MWVGREELGPGRQQIPMVESPALSDEVKPHPAQRWRESMAIIWRNSDQARHDLDLVQLQPSSPWLWFGHETRFSADEYRRVVIEATREELSTEGFDGLALDALANSIAEERLQIRKSESAWSKVDRTLVDRVLHRWLDVRWGNAEVVVSRPTGVEYLSTTSTRFPRTVSIEFHRGEILQPTRRTVVEAGNTNGVTGEPTSWTVRAEFGLIAVPHR